MLDWSAFIDSITAAAQGALSEAAVLVADVARGKAPVRKIFAGGRRTMRRKSIAEAEADRRMLISLGPQFAAPPRSTLRHARSRFMQAVTKGNPQNTPFSLSKRQLAGPGQLANAGSSLSRRGRSELKTMRAAFNGSLGGRLQAEIYATEATVDGSMVVAEVISPTPYAKFQEFGTRHNPAHPFLRPALEESREQVVAMVARAVARAAASSLGGGSIRYTIRLEAD